VTFYKTQCSLINDSAMDQDLAINTFYHQATNVGTDEEEAEDIETAVRNFYAAIDSMLSINVQSTNGLRIKSYNHTDVPPRVPVRDTLGDVTPGADFLPNECAIVLSFQQDPASGMNRRRQRGRVYIGPLSRASMEDGVGDARISAGAMSAIADGAVAHLQSFVGSASGSTFTWSVFSRSDALGLAVGEAGPATEPTYSALQLADGYHAVESVWVDNAYDTQRRRGLVATIRTPGV
jgi:hypothetical protein